MIVRRFVLVISLLAGMPTLGWAQFDVEPAGKGVQFGATKTQKYKAGVIIRAVGGSCEGLYGTVPVPMDWPEQQVRVIDEQLSPEVRKTDYRVTNKIVKQLLFQIPQLPANQEAKALVTFEVTRRVILPPSDTSVYKIPKRLPREVRIHMGPSPYIESTNPKIRALAKQIVKDQPTDWKKVEAIYDTVREKVKYEKGKVKGAAAALREGKGDCEELSALFIALCRASGIPARLVRVPKHCYPEFYLVDQEDKGHWFPCQAAGTRAFGEISELRPILQKGDNFRLPEKPKDRKLYVSEFLRGVPSDGGGEPKVQFVREILN